jgi:hypothetical protein
LELGEEERRRLAARERRRLMLAELTEASYQALLNANLRTSDEYNARDKLNYLRGMFSDLITAGRLEFGLPTTIQQNQEVTLNADDLAAAHRILGEAWPANRFDASAKTANRRMLLLVAPNNVDLVQLTVGTLDFTDIEPQARQEFAGELARLRQEHAVNTLYLHIGLSSAAQWLFLAQDAVEVDWFTNHIAGAKVLLLEAHDGASGAWAGMAEYVITLAASLPASEARCFTTAFWTGIGDGQAVEQAYADASAACSEQERGRIGKNW